MSGIEAAFFGALGRDAESKTSKTGKNYLRLNLRVGDGDTAQWVSVMTFDQSAIDAAASMTKGARVYIEGKLSLDEWSGQDGVKRHGLSVLSWHTRLSQIGRNKPTRESNKSARDPASANNSTANETSTTRSRCEPRHARHSEPRPPAHWAADQIALVGPARRSRGCCTSSQSSTRRGRTRHPCTC
jgi:single-stranded DNA-binding protein